VLGVSVEVPAAFAAIGYSGDFHLTVTFQGDVDREACRAKVPYLLGNSGWMVLEVNADGEGVLVRRDSAAICDLVFMPKLEAPDEG
jgi:hypothetical protein